MNAAYKEFTDNGFSDASTNKIVKTAGIGKGTLFYYFNNKQDLYLYLVNYALEVIEEDFFQFIDHTERDLIKRFKKIAKIKFQFLLEYPDMMNFMAKVMIEDDFQITKELQQRMTEIHKQGHTIKYENLDLSIFRKDMNPDRVFKLIQWMATGHAEELQNPFKHTDVTAIDYQPYFDEFDMYLNDIKTAFYQKGEGE